MHEAAFHRLDHPAVLARLRAYARDQLGRRPEVREVVLIGSLARGDWSVRSDADVVVVADELPTRPVDRPKPYWPAAPVGVPVDVLAYTPAEAREWRPRFAEQVRSGVVLYRRER